ncbi:MAG: hypothetical protein ACYCPT_12960 [Acidimicrobiales bacterium]
MERKYVIGIIVAVVILFIFIIAAVMLSSSSSKSGTNTGGSGKNTGGSGKNTGGSGKNTGGAGTNPSNTPAVQSVIITALPSTTYKYKGNTLLSGASLKQNEFLESTTGLYTLVMLPTGDLVINYYSSASATAVQIWHSNTANPAGWVGPWSLSLTKTGNLMILGNHGEIWMTNTKASTATTLKMQSDGDLVLTDANAKVLWHSGTSGQT